MPELAQKQTRFELYRKFISKNVVAYKLTFNENEIIFQRPEENI